MMRTEGWLDRVVHELLDEVDIVTGDLILLCPLLFRLDGNDLKAHTGLPI